MDFTLGAKSTDELLVLFVLAIFCQTAKTGGSNVKSLRTLVESLLEPPMDLCFLQDL